MIKKIIFIALLMFFATAWAEQNVEPLPIDKAFVFSATARDYQTILAMWDIAPGYYLYRDRFHFKVMKPKDAQIGAPLLPLGIHKFSPELGKYQVFEKSIVIPLPVIKGDSQKLKLLVSYQGCAAAGYCYPPTSKIVTVNLAGNYMQPTYGQSAPQPTLANAATVQPQSATEKLFTSKNVFIFIFGFFVIGLLISLTPCILPMIPVLSGIIMGQKKITHLHSFLLSLAYVLGMAITYAIAGVIFGYLGSSVQAAWQKPWFIIPFSLVFIALALSLFGFYDIQLPEKFRSKFAHASDKQKPGTYFGVAIMGVFSTLILSPCVTPPLVGVLGYISQSSNAVLGGVALFMMGIGMGVPLLLIGAFGPKLLPKTGNWMNATKVVMGFLLLGVAIWMLQRVLPGSITMIFWAALAIGAAIWMGALSTVKGYWQLLRKAVGIVIFIYGILLVIGATTGNYDPLSPIRLSPSSSAEQKSKFIPVKTIEDVRQKLADPQYQNKFVTLDFYADWCVSCKEMDRFTFNNAKVKERLKSYLLLRADVTANDEKDIQLEKYFHVVAPPTIIFFNRQHEEIKNARIIGEMSAKKFLEHLNKVEKENP